LSSQRSNASGSWCLCRSSWPECRRPSCNTFRSRY
jgi:hypothetical protein